MARKWIIGMAWAGMLVPLWIVGEARGLRLLLLEFPPLTQYVAHAAYSPSIFFLFLLLFLIALCVLVRPDGFGFAVTGRTEAKAKRHPFPRWGWVGLGLGMVFWIIAWGRFAALPAWLNRNTFFPLWLGYILVMDGLAFRRAGSSWIARSPRLFLCLFPASAVSWWYFEFINRFVQNWWYAGVETYSAVQYIGMATLSFSTVFPAIFTTQEWLSTFAWFDRAYRQGPRWNVSGHPVWWGAAALAGVGLLGLTLWHPVPFFFLTWVAPLLILAPGLALAGVATPFDTWRAGDYHQAFTLAWAALICGGFWEMWNYFSLPKWLYTVPYVQALEVFEMPLPGFAGYLPFGPVCWCMWVGLKALFTRGQRSVV